MIKIEKANTLKKNEDPIVKALTNALIEKEDKIEQLRNEINERVDKLNDLGVKLEKKA